MRFQLAVNMERIDDSLAMRDVARHTLEMVQMAEAGGFDIVWAAEHHALEMTIAPNPFQILAWWGQHTSRIRLGTAVATAAYWHPINLAGEAAFLDLISDGRLEFGIGSGAYQREFDRMQPGLKQSDAWRYMQEMLPAVRALWQGDYAHDGEFWQFPTSTSVPKPVQSQVPIWVAARSPITYDFAMRERCQVLCWPLTRPHAEAELYKRQLNEAIEKADNGWVPRFALMRHACIYDNAEDRQRALNAIRTVLSQFENLFRNAGDVVNGLEERTDERLCGQFAVRNVLERSHQDKQGSITVKQLPSPTVGLLARVYLPPVTLMVTEPNSGNAQFVGFALTD